MMEYKNVYTICPFCGVGCGMLLEVLDGAVTKDGRIFGTYLHGLFAADGFRRAFLDRLGAPSSQLGYDDGVERTLDWLRANPWVLERRA